MIREANRLLRAVLAAALLGAGLFGCTWGENEADAQTTNATQSFTFRIQAGTFLLRTLGTPDVDVNAESTRYDLTSEGTLEFTATQALPNGLGSPLSLSDGDVVVERPVDSSVTVRRRVL